MNLDNLCLRSHESAVPPTSSNAVIFYKQKSLCCCCSVKSCLTCDLMDCSPPVHVALLSMGFPRQEYWSELPFPTPGDLLNPGIEPVSPALAGGFITIEPPGKPTFTLLFSFSCLFVLIEV